MATAGWHFVASTTDSASASDVPSAYEATVMTTRMPCAQRTSRTSGAKRLKTAAREGKPISIDQRADPGNVAYLIRTDLMVHFTLQRAFPWSRVALFTEELPCPTAVFLSEKDCLVPSDVRCSESSSDELRRRACNETTSNASTSPFLIP